MICARCPQRDVCDLAGKDDPLLTGCDASHGTWAFDRLRLDRMTADRDALSAGLERTKEELERVRRNHLRRMARVSGMRSRELFDEARMAEAEPDCWLRRSSRRLFRLATEARAALERKDGASHGT